MPSSRSAPLNRTGQSFWLVKTGIGASEIQRFTAGQKPIGNSFKPGRTGYPSGSAIYLGPTVADANKYTAKAAKQLGVPNPHNVPSLSTSVGIIGSILGGFGAGAAATGADAGTAAASAGAGDATAAGASGGGVAAGARSAASNLPTGLKGAALYGGVAAAITSPLDFLKFIAWIFHPRNILRAVEFLVGIALMVFGFNAAMQARGEKVEGFSTSEGAITRSGLGRVATELGRAARGGGGGSSGRTPQRPRSAPHRTRQRALTQRYSREEDLQRRRAKAPRRRKSP